MADEDGIVGGGAKAGAVAGPVASARSTIAAIQRRCVAVIMAGALFGVVSGLAGAAARHEMESSDGVATSDHRALHQVFGLIALPTLPGFLIAEQRSGIGDWQIDEAWFFRWQVCGWNTLAWALLGSALTPLIALWSVIRRTRH
jgi:hypothetical protein